MVIHRSPRVGVAFLLAFLACWPTSGRPTVVSGDLIAGMANDRDGKILFASNRTGRFEIFIMNADGSAPRQLTQSPSTSMNHHPVFTPDGGQFVWAQDSVLRRWDFDSQQEVGEPIEMADHPWVGRDWRVYFTRMTEGVHTIWSAELDGSDEQQLTDARVDRFHACLHPEKDIVLFTRADKDLQGREIRFLDLQSGDIADRGYAGTSFVSGATWHPNGDRFIVAEKAGDTYSVVEVSYPSLESRVLIRSAADHTVPYYAFPRGESFVWTYHPGGRRTREICVADEPGFAGTNLTRHPADDVQIAGHEITDPQNGRCARPPVGCNPVPPTCDINLPATVRDSAEELGRLVGRRDSVAAGRPDLSDREYSAFTAEELRSLAISDGGSASQQARQLLSFISKRTGVTEARMVEEREGVENLFVNNYLLALAEEPVRADPYLESTSLFEGQTDQWGLKRINLPIPGDRASQIKPVIVAVIDTGLDFLHPDLRASSVWRNNEEVENGRDDDRNGYVDDVIGWDFVGDDNNPWDDCGRGTAVSGLIAARSGNGRGIAGANDRAIIMPLKTLNFTGRGRAEHGAEALCYAANNEARIVVLSFGDLRLSETEKVALTHAAAHDVLVIATDCHAQDASFVTGLGNVVRVGATTPDDGLADFCGSDQTYDILAPGVDVLSLRARHTDYLRASQLLRHVSGTTVIGPMSEYYVASGAPLAGALVAGVASLVLGIDPTLSAAEVRTMLCETARPVGCCTEPGVVDAEVCSIMNPAFWVDASLEARTVDDAIEVTAMAQADELGAVWLDVRIGEESAEWQKEGDTITGPVATGTVLSRIQLKDLDRAASTVMMRLTVEHGSGIRRTLHYNMKLDTFTPGGEGN